MLKELLESGKCFKLVCGAGNEDVEEVERLVALYSAAGCKFFDLSAKPEVVEAAKRGLRQEAALCVSVGIKGDPHINKAQINYEKCKSCGICDEICPQKAIKYHKVKTSRCIGCGKCAKACPQKAISYISQNMEPEKVLPPLIDMGIDCIELHAMGEDDTEVFDKWNYMNKTFNGLLSICTARKNLSDEKMILRLKNMLEIREPYTTIIQADGYPMSGSKDDYKTTLQTVATAEIVQDAKLPVYLMLSGGTNSKTAELAKLCGIKYNGIAVGTFARKIVKKYIERDDFLRNQTVFNEALAIAQQFVSACSAPFES